MKKQNGITLIALIITIVILLVLAVVTIGAVQNGGIITHAQDTKLIYQIAQIEEALKLKMQEEKLAIAAGELVVGTGSNINSYHSWVEFMKLAATEMPSVSYGNIYSDTEPNKGELIGKNLLWLATDCISGSGIFETEEELPFLPLGINTSLGQNGEYFDFVDINTGRTSQLEHTDIFFFDENYNIYYIDGEGNVITSKGIYKVSEIYVGSEYFNPEVSLTPAEKAIYDGIYEGAYAFSKDPRYAEKLATADFVLTEDGIGAFFAGGYGEIGAIALTDSEGNILEFNGNKIEKSAILCYNPDGTTLNLSEYYIMDSNYNMYKVDTENNTIEDKDGNVLQVNSKIKQASSETHAPEGVIIPEGYTVVWRFDGKGINITDVPDKVELDMATDFAGFEYEIYAIQHRLFRNKTTQRLILPNKMTKLSNVDTSFASGTESGVELTLGAFEKCTNLTYIKLPNDMRYIYADEFKNCTNLREVIMPYNIQRIGQNAFNGCTNITLRFKDGVAPEGAPWGGSYSTMTITSR